jgi:hypothetical protein
MQITPVLIQPRNDILLRRANAVDEARTATKPTPKSVVSDNCKSHTPGVACAHSGSVKAKPSG